MHITMASTHKPKSHDAPDRKHAVDEVPEDALAIPAEAPAGAEVVAAPAMAEATTEIETPAPAKVEATTPAPAKTEAKAPAAAKAEAKAPAKTAAPTSATDGALKTKTAAGSTATATAAPTATSTRTEAKSAPEPVRTGE